MWDDIVIVHFINKFVSRPPVKKFIFSCHEQHIFPIREVLNFKIFDKIHFVSDHQRQFHNVDHPYFIIPNILDNLRFNKKPNGKIAGIIGSIDKNKQVHISIENALRDGCEKVFIYGAITDFEYWNENIVHLIDGNRVIYKGYVEDKQKIYDSITDVYHSSNFETWGYIKGECKLTNTVYHGNKSTDGYWEMSKEDILKSWLEELLL
jgi:hypothetical protein